MADLHPVKTCNAAAKAKLLPKFQRYFRRKPLRFFTFVAFYLTAGSLVILHAGFRGETSISEVTPRDGSSTAEGTGAQSSVKLPLSREFKTMPESLGPRYGSWFRTPSKDAPGRGRGTDDGEMWIRVVKGRNVRKEERARYIGCYKDNTRQRTLRGVSFFDYKKMTLFRCQNNCAERGYLFAGLEFGVECYCGDKIQAAKTDDAECYMACSGGNSSICGGANRLSIYRLKLTQESATRRHGSALFRGCFRQPENLSSAFLMTRRMKNISVDQCVDFCTGKEYPLAALAGTSCHCGFPTTLFSLREREGDHLCAEKCSGEEFDNCGSTDYFVVYQTQAQDKRCMDRRFRTAPPKELVALASFPGAGNTWARHLIELATGFYTGSYYFDGSLYNKEFKGEQENWRSGRTICIKTHESGQKEIEAFDSAILLIRNPYKALMAEFNRKYGGHIGFASYAHWAGKDWPEFVQSYAPWWAAHTLNWLTYRKKVLVVHFEDLKRDLFVQLKRMVHFLGAAVHEDRLLCVEGQKDGNFKRSGLRKLEYDPYTPKMRKMINGYIQIVDTALKHRNLTGVPEEYYPR